MFVLKASVWLAALEAFRPDIAEATRKAWAAQIATPASCARARPRSRPCRAESVDYAVMEHCPGSAFDIRMVPWPAGWSDLGAWDAVWQMAEKDAAGNASVGDVLLQDSRNTLVHATSRLVSVVGLDDVVVVETPDAVMVSDRARSQEVKKVVETLSARQRERADLPPQGASPLGLVRQHRQRLALPGQAHHGQPRRDAEPADALPSRRALDRRVAARPRSPTATR